MLTLRELADKEQAFWQRVTPVGVVFDIGMVMGFIVGMAICYQVLFSEISDRLAEFATLKAMGYTNQWLLWVVVAEAVFLALLGYGVGFVLSQLAFLAIHDSTGLPDDVEAGRRRRDPRADPRHVHAFRHPGGAEAARCDPAELYA